jgi:hypothetical protein
VARGRKQNRPVSTGMQDSALSQEQVAALAKMTWERNPKLHREFRSQGAYVAFCKAEAAGRVRRLDKPKDKQNRPPEQRRDLLSDLAGQMFADPRFVGLASAEDNALRVLAQEGFPSKLQAAERPKAPPLIVDAYQMLDMREELSIRLERLVKSPGVSPGVLEEILLVAGVAFQLGWLVQQLRFSPFVPDMVSGGRARKGGEKGSKKAHSPEKREERERERREWRAEYARLAEAHPRMSRTGIARHVGRTFGVDERTILRYTSFPKKN